MKVYVCCVQATAHPNPKGVLDDNLLINAKTYSFNKSSHNITLKQRTVASTWLLYSVFQVCVFFLLAYLQHMIIFCKGRDW